MKIMDKLSTYAALLGVIGAIGGGFYTWGQFNSRLDAIESTPAVNLSPLKEKDKELNLNYYQANKICQQENKQLPIFLDVALFSRNCFKSLTEIFAVLTTNNI